MAVDIWGLRAGDVVDLGDGVIAEVIAPTEDGQWFGVRYLAAPAESAWLLGTIDAVADHEVEAVLTARDN